MLSLCKPHDRGNVSLRTIFIVAEHVETRTGRRHQHGSTGLGYLCGKPDRIRHGGGLSRVGQVAELLIHPAGGFTDQDQMAHPGFHERSKRSVRSTLVLSSGYQGDVFEAFQSLYNASDIGRLAVLVITHPAKLANKLHPVMERTEVPHTDETLAGAAAEKKSRCQCRHDIFEVVNPLEAKSGSRKACFTPFMSVDDLVPYAEHTLIKLIPAAEGEYSCLQALRILPDERVVHVQDREILSRLILEYPQLGVYILLICRITVQMVFTDVQQSCHFRTEGGYPLQ